MSSCSLLLHTLIPFISIFVRAVYITYRCCKRFCESDCIVVICFSFMERGFVSLCFCHSIFCINKSFLLCCKTCGPHCTFYKFTFLSSEGNNISLKTGLLAPRMAFTAQTGSLSDPTRKVTSHSSGRWARKERSLHKPPKSF